MTVIKNYLLHVCAASLLLSLIKTILPEGRVRFVAVFCGALLIVLIVISPLTQVRTVDMAEAIARFQMDTKQIQSGIEVKNREILEQIISQQCQAYILDEAEQLGVEIAIQVEMNQSGQYPYPVSIEVSGTISEEKREYLSGMIERDLGIPADKQKWE